MVAIVAFRTQIRFLGPPFPGKSPEEIGSALLVSTLVRLRAHERSVHSSCRGGWYRRFANCSSSSLSVRSTWSLEKVLREAQQQHETAAAHAGYSRPQPALPRPALSSSKVMADRAQDFAMNQNMVTSASTAFLTCFPTRYSMNWRRIVVTRRC